jgi:DNA repair exonuclease SbcCD ATPase subunit
VSIEQRILFLSEAPDCNQSRELRAIALEVRKREDRIKQLEEELERTKQDRNAIAKNTREPLLLQLDHANERIKQLEDRIHRAASAFFRDGSDGQVASGMLQILEEERGQK